MANMTFKTNILPNSDLGYSLGSSENPQARWNIYGNLTGDVTGNATNVTGTVAIANGGTGATTAADARTNLSLNNVTNDTQAPAINGVYYGVCGTGASTKAKTVTLTNGTNFQLATGCLVAVKFTYASAAETMTLNVNGTGAKTLRQYGSTNMSSGTTTNGWPANAVVLFVYDGTDWKRVYWYNSTYYTTAVYINTAGDTAAKVGTGSYYSDLTTSKYIPMLLINSNTKAAALTLNINSKGAKSIYINGTASSSTNYTLPAGYYIVYYDGTNYHFRTDSKMAGNLAGNADTATGANLTTTAYGLAYYTNTAGTFGEVDPNTTSTKKFLSMTGTGSAGATPGWVALTASDVLPAQTNNSGKFLTTNGSALSWSNVPLTVDYGTTLPLSGSNGDLYFTPPIGDTSSMVINATTDKIYVTGIKAAGDTTLYYNSDVYAQGSVLYGAAWNDYAEYRESFEVNPGRVIIELGNGRLIRSTERLQPGAEIVSDTYGFVIGKGNPRCSTPVAISGRVLAYPYEERHTFAAGDAVCSGPNGTVSKMTREEIKEYPERIIGTVSEVPEYETWGPNNIRVHDRIWIRIR